MNEINKTGKILDCQDIDARNTNRPFSHRTKFLQQEFFSILTLMEEIKPVGLIKFEF